MPVAVGVLGGEEEGDGAGGRERGAGREDEESEGAGVLEDCAEEEEEEDGESGNEEGEGDEEEDEEEDGEEEEEEEDRGEDARTESERSLKCVVMDCLMRSNGAAVDFAQSKLCLITQSHMFSTSMLTFARSCW